MNTKERNELKEKHDNLLGEMSKVTFSGSAEPIAKAMLELREAIVGDPNEDLVNKPSHYQSKDGLECIDIIYNMTMGMHPSIAIPMGNVIKYLYRSHSKNGSEDINKAEFYANEVTKNSVALSDEDKDNCVPKNFDDMYRVYSIDELIAMVCNQYEYDIDKLAVELILNNLFRLASHKHRTHLMHEQGNINSFSKYDKDSINFMKIRLARQFEVVKEGF